VVTRAGQFSPPVDARVVVDPQPAKPQSGGQAILVHNADFTSTPPRQRPLVSVRGSLCVSVRRGPGRTSNQPADGSASCRPSLQRLWGVSRDGGGFRDVHRGPRARVRCVPGELSLGEPPAGSPDLAVAIGAAARPKSTQRLANPFSKSCLTRQLYYL
jgi:hypothetical protein